MSRVAAKWLANTAALAAAILMTSCAVGPDFLQPVAPEVTRYTREPLASRTSSTDVASGPRQIFRPGQDIPQEWWRLFRSPALNALIERALQNNPNLQSALATLRTTRESVYAQEGKFFPLAQANFIPERERSSGALSPVLSTPASVFNLVTAQVLVSYTFDVWGLNRRTVESLEALSDVQRFQVEAAYLALTANLAVAAITEASLRGQIEATEQMISINKKILEIIRHQFETGFVSRNEVALQEAALAQVEATLPALRKALALQRDLNTALPSLIAPQNLFLVLAGNATQTVFDGGTLLHQLQGTKDTYQAAAWTYAGTVVGAVQNVADALHAVRNDADALKAARDFQRAAKVSLDLAQQQMQTGYANILILLTAEQTYLLASLQVVQARAARLSDTAALFQALGGGWWNREDLPEQRIVNVGTGEADIPAERPGEFRSIWSALSGIFRSDTSP